MRKVQIRKRLSIIFFVVISLGSYLSCSKTDHPAVRIDTTLKTDAYFTVPVNTDASIIAIADKLNRMNAQSSFKDELIKNAGYAQWKFAKVVNSNASSRGGSTDKIINIPFVKNHVNATAAILVVGITATDTTFQLMYPQHYILYEMEADSSTSLMKASDYFNAFASFDYMQFGIDQYFVNDGRIFGFNKNDTLQVTIEYSGDGNGRLHGEAVNMQNAATMTTCTTTKSCVYVGASSSAKVDLVPKQVDPGKCVTTTSCTDVILVGGGGSAGSSSGGSSSSGTGTGIGGNSSNGNGTATGGGTPTTLIATNPCVRIAVANGRLPTATDPCTAQPWVPVIVDSTNQLILTFDPNNPFADLQHPYDAPSAPHIVSMDGITLSDVPDGASTNMSRLIGRTNNRGNTEDMLYETNGDASGITTGMTPKTDAQLFSDMDWLFYYCTIYNNDLEQVGKTMMQKFKDRTGGTFEDPVLNREVHDNISMDSFFIKFGDKLRDEITKVNGDINQVGIIEMGSTRPKFNSFHDKFHGLQILINDTEYTEIQINDYYLDPTGAWTADVMVTIHDHFGLDKHDALTYQVYNTGFAAWWLLQHTRGYRPFETIVHVKRRINGFR